MVGRRIACSLSVILLVASFLGVYYTYFKRPPVHELMRMNNRRGSMATREDSTSGNNKSRNVDMAGQHLWQTFVRNNNYVAVGDVWDRGCEDQGRTAIGTVVMIPDEENGGVMTRTFINYTLKVEIEEGELFLEVQYNHQHLFDNHWDLCTVEDDMEPEERTVFCPVKTGFISEVKDKKIPAYLPKGQYYTKSWITNQDGATVMCGYSDFVL